MKQLIMIPIKHILTSNLKLIQKAVKNENDLSSNIEFDEVKELNIQNYDAAWLKGLLITLLSLGTFIRLP